LEKSELANERRERLAAKPFLSSIEARI